MEGRERGKSISALEKGNSLSPGNASEAAAEFLETGLVLVFVFSWPQ